MFHLFFILKTLELKEGMKIVSWSVDKALKNQIYPPSYACFYKEGSSTHVLAINIKRNHKVKQYFIVSATQQM